MVSTTRRSAALSAPSRPQQTFSPDLVSTLHTCSLSYSHLHLLVHTAIVFPLALAIAPSRSVPNRVWTLRTDGAAVGIVTSTTNKLFGSLWGVAISEADKAELCPATLLRRQYGQLELEWARSAGQSHPYRHLHHLHNPVSHRAGQLYYWLTRPIMV